jgi:transposase
MRPGISVTLSASDRSRLEDTVNNRQAPQKHVWRAKIVLLSADGFGTLEILRRVGISKTCVWRWQERFAQSGVDGLLRDKTRPSRVPPLGQEIIDKVELTATEPLHEATHWTAAAMVKAAGMSVSSVQRIWKAHGLAPHQHGHAEVHQVGLAVLGVLAGDDPVPALQIQMLPAIRPTSSRRWLVRVKTFTMEPNGKPICRAASSTRANSSSVITRWRACSRRPNRALSGVKFSITIARPLSILRRPIRHGGRRPICHERRAEASTG